MTLSLDMSEAIGAINVAIELSQNLRWPTGENFRRDLDAMIDAGDAVEIITGRGLVSYGIASARLIDLIARYQGK